MHAPQQAASPTVLTVMPGLIGMFLADLKNLVPRTPSRERQYSQNDRASEAVIVHGIRQSVGILFVSSQFVESARARCSFPHRLSKKSLQMQKDR